MSVRFIEFLVPSGQVRVWSRKYNCEKWNQLPQRIFKDTGKGIPIKFKGRRGVSGFAVTKAVLYNERGRYAPWLGSKPRLSRERTQQNKESDLDHSATGSHSYKEKCERDTKVSVTAAKKVTEKSLLPIFGRTLRLLSQAPMPF